MKTEPPMAVIEERPARSETIIELPMFEGELDGFVPRSIELRGLTAEERDALERLYRGARRSDAQLQQGRQVRTRPDALRLVLQRLAGL